MGYVYLDVGDMSTCYHKLAFISRIKDFILISELILQASLYTCPDNLNPYLEAQS